MSKLGTLGITDNETAARRATPVRPNPANVNRGSGGPTRTASVTPPKPAGDHVVIGIGAQTLASITSASSRGNPMFRSAVSRCVTLSNSAYAAIFGSEDRGARVCAVETAIRQGVINPQEVQNA